MKRRIQAADSIRFCVRGRGAQRLLGQAAQAGLKLAGLSPDERLVEIVELPDHPWFVGVQFHPELKSRPNKAHPLFRDFIATAKRYHGQE